MLTSEAKIKGSYILQRISNMNHTSYRLCQDNMRIELMI